MAAVGSGHISFWSAHRVLASLACANAEHARKLADSLKKEPLSTRNLALFLTTIKGPTAVHLKIWSPVPVFFSRHLRVVNKKAGKSTKSRP